MTQIETIKVCVDSAALGRIAVLTGGFSSEREVSLMSGAGVLKALRSKGCDAHGFDPAERPIEELRGKFDRAFIALHGKFGEDGSVQGALEYMKIPYTGPGVCASAIAMNKDLTRKLWAQSGIPVAKGRLVKSAGEAAAIIDELGCDLVVKPATEGSSLGVVKLASITVAELGNVLSEAFAAHADVLVEERVFGHELTVAVFQGKALPIVEIKAPEGDYDFQNKYYTDVVQYVCPAEIKPEHAAAVQRACEAAYAALGCRSWSRVDVMMREDGSFILLEINTSPGMTPHSLVPTAARACGMSYEDLCLLVASTASLDNKAAA